MLLAFVSDCHQRKGFNDCAQFDQIFHQNKNLMSLDIVAKNCLLSIELCKSYNMACERKGRGHMTRKCDIFGDGDAIQIENGDCDCCNHWKHHTFSSSVLFTSQKDKS